MTDMDNSQVVGVLIKITIFLYFFIFKLKNP